MEFELIENNVTTKYRYLGDIGHADFGLDFEYPSENTKSEWYKNLISQNDFRAAACLGSLTYELKMSGDISFKESFGDIYEIVNSKLFSEFTNKWFDPDGSVFSEPSFFDGFFGQFSSYGELGYPDNYEEENSKVLLWDKEKIKINLLEGIDCFDELSDTIFINQLLEVEFKSHLKLIIELFNPDAQV